jgi:hypothetical protein
LAQGAITSKEKVMSHTGWNGQDFSAGSFGLAATLAGAFGAMLHRSAHFGRRHYLVSARALRLADEEFRQADMHLMELRLQHAQDHRRRAERRAAEAEADLVHERLRER